MTDEAIPQVQPPEPVAQEAPPTAPAIGDPAPPPPAAEAAPVPEVAVPEAAPVAEAAAAPAATAEAAPAKKGGKPRSEFPNWVATQYKDKDAPFTDVQVDCDPANNIVTLRCTTAGGKTTTSKIRVNGINTVG
jgi:hypothetical protein